VIYAFQPVNAASFVHAGERPYHCGACGQRYTQGHLLKAHIRSRHGSEMAYYNMDKRSDGVRCRRALNAIRAAAAVHAVSGGPSPQVNHGSSGGVGSNGGGSGAKEDKIRFLLEAAEATRNNQQQQQHPVPGATSSSLVQQASMAAPGGPFSAMALGQYVSALSNCLPPPQQHQIPISAGGVVGPPPGLVRGPLIWTPSTNMSLAAAAAAAGLIGGPAAAAAAAAFQSSAAAAATAAIQSASTWFDGQRCWTCHDVARRSAVVPCRHAVSTDRWMRSGWRSTATFGPRRLDSCISSRRPWRRVAPQFFTTDGTVRRRSHRRHWPAVRPTGRSRCDGNQLVAFSTSTSRFRFRPPVARGSVDRWRQTSNRRRRSRARRWRRGCSNPGDDANGYDELPFKKPAAEASVGLSLAVRPQVDVGERRQHVWHGKKRRRKKVVYNIGR
jgi:hypothetical protein